MKNSVFNSQVALLMPKSMQLLRANCDQNDENSRKVHVANTLHESILQEPCSLAWLK
jgi:hypothetical protein